jgi:hypothetical protein
VVTRREHRSSASRQRRDGPGVRPDNPDGGPLPSEVLLATRNGVSNREVVASMSVPPGQSDLQRTDTTAQAPTGGHGHHRATGGPPWRCGP